MSAMASQITESRLFPQPFVQAQIKENIKVTGISILMEIHRWPVDSPHKEPITQIFFLHLMTSPWVKFRSVYIYFVYIYIHVVISVCVDILASHATPSVSAALTTNLWRICFLQISFDHQCCLLHQAPFLKMSYKVFAGYDRISRDNNEFGWTNGHIRDLFHNHVWGPQNTNLEKMLFLRKE